MHKVYTILFVLWCVALVGCQRQPAVTQTKKSGNTLELTERMFAHIRAKTDWNLDGDMLWGYYFVGTDRVKLERAAEKLTAAGYRLVDIFPDEDKTIYFLHVERIEKHTALTLHALEGELERFATKNGLESYDGMDVGPVLTK